MKIFIYTLLLLVVICCPPVFVLLGVIQGNYDLMLDGLLLSACAALVMKLLKLRGGN